MLSPQRGVADGRNGPSSMVRMNNTMQDGMFSNGGLSIVGGRKEGWENPDTTARNGLGQRDYSMTVREVVDNVMKK